MSDTPDRGEPMDAAPLDPPSPDAQSPSQPVPPEPPQQSAQPDDAAPPAAEYQDQTDEVFRSERDGATESEPDDQPAGELEDALAVEAPEDGQDEVPPEPVEPETPAEPEPAAEQEPPEDKPAAPRAPTIVARYGVMQHIGEFRCSLDPLPRPGSHVVVRTDRGVELGEVLSVVESDAPGGRRLTPKALGEFLAACGADYPFRRGGRVLRQANPQDVIDHRHLQQSSHEESSFCREQIRALNLPMRLVAVEHLLGGERILFYFTSETRVDFRELVRTLAGQYRTRIEMRQVGARDEARLIADYERCGQRCCCQQFLKDLRPVSMRMAKTQKATLDPSKISGRCGRLMCCLRYEDQTYEELRKLLPRRNCWVRCGQTVGKVIDAQIITQLVRLVLPNGSTVTIGNEEIEERNVPPVEVERPEPRKAPVRERSTRLLRDDAQPSSAPAADGPTEPSGEQPVEADEPVEGVEAQSPAEAPASAGEPGEPGEPGARKGKRRRPRRRKGKRPAGQGAQGEGGGQAGPPPARSAEGGPPAGRQAPGGGDGSGKSGSRRRRRRRKPRGGGGGGGDGGGGSPPSGPPSD